MKCPVCGARMVVVGFVQRCPVFHPLWVRATVERDKPIVARKVYQARPTTV